MNQQQQSLKPEGKNKFVNLLFINAELKQTTFKKTILFYVFMALLFIAISIALFIVLNDVTEYEILYDSPGDNKCQPFHETNQPCIVNVTIEEMKGEVYLMYSVGNFYQNHRRYIQSKSNYQLAGNEIESVDDASVCSPYITNEQMNKSISWGSQNLSRDAIASPCGAIALTFFNDTFAMQSGSGQNITINETGISWPGDRGYKYKRSADSEANQWMDPENEHFIVWMRTAGLPNFRKLWGRIEDGLPAGNYNILIENNYSPEGWQGNRYVILTTNSLFGGKNFVLPSAFLVLGVSCIVASFFFWRKWQSDKNHME